MFSVRTFALSVLVELLIGVAAARSDDVPWSFDSQVSWSFSGDKKASAPSAEKAPCTYCVDCKCKEGDCPGKCPVRWHTDYDTAITEAKDKKRPILTVIGTADCVYCTKLEEGPLKSAAFSELARDFVCLKLDAAANPSVVKALKIESYPTLFLASHDRKILTRVNGYLESAKLNEQLRKAVKSDAATEPSASAYRAATAEVVAAHPKPQRSGTTPGTFVPTAAGPSTASPGTLRAVTYTNARRATRDGGTNGCAAGG